MVVIESKKDKVRLEITDNFKVITSEAFHGIYNNESAKIKHSFLANFINNWKESEASKLYYENMIIEKIYDDIHFKYRLEIFEDSQFPQEDTLGSHIEYLSDFTCFEAVRKG